MIVRLENVQFSYPNSNGFLVLKNVSLEINGNEFIGIVGPSGSGKTTLLEIIKGLLNPTKGLVFYDDFSVDAESSISRDISKKIGLLFQFPEKQLFEDTVYEDIAFAPKNFGLDIRDIESAVKKSLNLVDLEFSSVESKSPFNLSGGEKRRVALAGVLAMNPDVLMLDEPTTGVDNFGLMKIEKTLRRLHDNGKTILIVSHDMDFIFHNVDRIIGIKNGEIIFDGSKSDFFSDHKLLNTLKMDMPSFINWLKNNNLTYDKSISQNEKVRNICKLLNMR